MATGPWTRQRVSLQSSVNTPEFREILGSVRHRYHVGIAEVWFSGACAVPECAHKARGVKLILGPH